MMPGISGIVKKLFLPLPTAHLVVSFLRCCSKWIDSPLPAHDEMNRECNEHCRKREYERVVSDEEIESNRDAIDDEPFHNPLQWMCPHLKLYKKRMCEKLNQEKNGEFQGESHN